MSKRTKARREELIRSMEGLSVLKAPESTPAAPVGPNAGKPAFKYAIGLIAGIGVVVGLWFMLRH